MKILERHKVDDYLWNKLVSNSPDSSFFSYTWYLDATAKNWDVLVDESYSFGIALPYMKVKGVEVLYTPVFVRYIEVLGDPSKMGEASEIITERFVNMDISVKQKLFDAPCSEFIYQSIQSINELGSQATRMIKKARQNSLNIDINEDYDSILKTISNELKLKFKGIDRRAISSLENIFQSAKEQGVLRAYNLSTAGGIVCLENEKEILYLKGATSEADKKNGAMYLVLDAAIKDAVRHGKKFDFGGSRIEGVRRFNHNLGGTDVTYFNYRIDNLPHWFKFARRIKKTWSK